MYQSCELCPHRCGVDRTAGECGICGQSSELRIAAALMHRGEEPPLDRGKGVGNVFLSGCSMSCVYCQNYQTSQDNMGEIVLPEYLAGKMLDFQKQGLSAAGWVTPAHFLPGLIRAYNLASKDGFQLPLIYNTSSYENVETVRLLDGIADVYLADMRYSDAKAARKYSGIDNYAEISHYAVTEMYEQTGAFGEDRMHGLIIRILVLPNDIAGLWETLCFIALELSPKIPVSLMSQYAPFHQARGIDTLSKPIKKEEYDRALTMTAELGFETVYAQELLSQQSYYPDFRKKENPFKD